MLHDLLAAVRPHCLESPWLVLAYIAGHSWIAWSYLRIPATLAAMRRRAGGWLMERGEVKSVERFVRACAGTHLFWIATLFFPRLDWVAAAQLLYAGLVSHMTARLLRREAATIVSEVMAARALEDRIGHALAAS